MIVFVLFILGLIVGSYLNVLILRLHTGKSTAGRSGCLSCAEQLKWYELLPVVSYIALKGKCRTCGSSIVYQYWIVELCTAIVFAWVALQSFSIFSTIIALLLVSVLIVIAVYDIRHTIIPNEMVYSAFILAFLMNAPIIIDATLVQIVHYFVVICIEALLTAIPLLFLWSVSRGKWMGFGDVKLAMVFGVVLGVYDGFMALMIGFVLGAVVGVCILYMQRFMGFFHKNKHILKITMKSEVPFAPFLIVGFLLVFLGHIDIIVFLERLIV